MGRAKVVKPTDVVSYTKVLASGRRNPFSQIRPDFEFIVDFFLQWRYSMEAAGNFYLFNSHKADMITVQFQSGIKLIPIRY